MSDAAAPALIVSGISKTFGANRVLRDVELRVNPGEIRALVGENGSGKSTLVKILAGYHAPDPGTGSVTVAGRPLATGQREAGDAAGLRFVHQDLALISGLSTVENLGLGNGYGTRRGRPVRWAARRREAAESIARLGYEFDVDQPVARLQASERTAVAVARALSDHHSPPHVLVLDEPTANLPGREIERLFALVRTVRDSGLAVLFITHHLNEVFDLADTVTVLRDGRVVATADVTDITEPALIEMMVGRGIARGPRPGAAVRTNAVLEADGLAGRTLRGISLQVSAGEIVGVAGITGSGREAVAPLLFGAAHREGTVTIAGAVLKASRPDLSIAAGVGLIPAGRQENAVIHGLDVTENLTIARLTDFVRWQTVSRRAEFSEVKSWMARVGARPLRPRLMCTQLSGGNVQKVILARWLRLQPTVMLLDEPTQGVDIAAKEDIHQRLQAAAGDGSAILVCSADAEELVRLCSRVIVLVGGRISTELTAPLDVDEITAASLATRKE